MSESSSSSSTSPLNPLYMFIDYRESDLLAQMPFTVPPAYADSASRLVVSCNLHVGDIIFARRRRPDTGAPAPVSSDGGEEREKSESELAFGGGGDDDAVARYAHLLEPVLVVERKTAADMAASVVGSGSGGAFHQHRWSDQKRRVSAYCARTGARPALMLEGYYRHAVDGSSIGGKPRAGSGGGGANNGGTMSESSFRVALLHAGVRDGWLVVPTVNYYDTARTLWMMFAHLSQERVTAERWLAFASVHAHADTGLSVRKAANNTAHAWYVNMLASIPRVSVGVAREITKDTRFDALHKLVGAARDNASATRALLADVPLPDAKRTKNMQLQRIGPASAARIVAFVLGDASITGATKATAAARKRKQ